VLTLSAIHERLEASLSRLDALVDEVQEAGLAAARTESEYKSEAAKCRLIIRAKGQKTTVDQVEAQVQVECENLHLAYLIAGNNLTTVREAIRAATTKVDALRSLAAGFRNAGG
jgi:hypothetical protein